MIAAIYARKSTEQFRRDAEDTSVQLQMANGRACAAAKGWPVLDAHVLGDDAVSGADTRKLKNRQRLIDMIESGRAPFQVLIMRDISRFSREDGDEAVRKLKRIVQCGVQVWFYQDDEPFKFGNFGDNVVGFVRAEMAAEYRRQISKFTKEAHLRKVKAGHLVGGRCFGYDNICSVCGAVILAGKARCCREGHTERRINEAEAVVVRLIFKLCGDEVGLSTIARTLNAERARSPLAQRNRPRGWCPSSVRAVLHRELYRGVIVWNRTCKRDPLGQINPEDRPADDWVRVPAGQLRIVPDKEWARAHAHLDDVRDKYQRANNGQLLGGRPVGTGTPKYLLTGLLVCGVCGASLEGRTRSHGRLRAPFYGCTAHRRKGSSICTNNFEIPMRDADHAVLSTIEYVMADPSVLQEILACALEELGPKEESETSDNPRAQLQRERADLDRQLTHLAAAIAEGGGDLSTVLAEIRTRERRRRDILRALATTNEGARERPTESGIRATLTAMLADWRALLRSHTEDGQRLVRRLIEGRLTVMPERDAEGRFYRWSGSATLSPLLASLRPHMVASPTGFEPVFWP